MKLLLSLKKVKNFSNKGFIMKAIPFLMAALFLSACASKKTHMGEKIVEKEGVLTLSGDSISTSGQNFSADLTIKNQSGGPLLIYLHDIKCNHGDQDGFVKSSGDRRISLTSGSVKSLNLNCILSKEGEGSKTFNISKVFTNPNGDGKTSGKMLAKDIVWDSGQN